MRSIREAKVISFKKTPEKSGGVVPQMLPTDYSDDPKASILGRTQAYWDRCPPITPPVVISRILASPRCPKGNAIAWHQHIDPKLVSLALSFPSGSSYVFISRGADKTARCYHIWYHELGHSIEARIPPADVARIVKLIKSEGYSRWTGRTTIGGMTYNTAQHGVLEREIWALACELYWMYPRGSTYSFKNVGTYDALAALLPKEG